MCCSVTGCSSGIGLDLTKTLSENGNTIYACVRKRAGSKTSEDLLSKLEGEKVKIIEGIDVTSDDVGETLQKALQGVKIDCLINNAGISGDFGDPPMSGQKLENITMENMRLTFEVNTLGPLKGMKKTIVYHYSIFNPNTILLN